MWGRQIDANTVRMDLCGGRAREGEEIESEMLTRAHTHSLPPSLPPPPPPFSLPLFLSLSQPVCLCLCRGQEVRLRSRQRYMQLQAKAKYPS